MYMGGTKSCAEQHALLSNRCSAGICAPVEGSLSGGKLKELLGVVADRAKGVLLKRKALSPAIQAHRITPSLRIPNPPRSASVSILFLRTCKNGQSLHGGLL